LEGIQAKGMDTSLYLENLVSIPFACIPFKTIFVLQLFQHFFEEKGQFSSLFIEKEGFRHLFCVFVRDNCFKTCPAAFPELFQRKTLLSLKKKGTG